MYTITNKFEEADALYTEALGIWGNVRGKSSPYYAQILNELSFLKGEMGDYYKALELFQEVTETLNKQLNTRFSSGSESQRMAFAGKLTIDWPLSLCAGPMKDKNVSKRFAFDLLLSRKGIVLESLVRQSEIIANLKSGRMEDILEDLNKSRSLMAQLVFSSPDSRTTKQYGDERAQLEKQVEDLEKNLANKSYEYRTLMDIQLADTEDVFSVMPYHSALVEFAVYKKYDFKKRNWDKYHYLALVLKFGKGALPEIIDLGEADIIDLKVKDLLDRINNDRDIKQTAQQLYEIVWNPTSENLGYIKKIIISPDGQLNLLPFEALIDEKGKYLEETFEISYLPSGRDLMRYKTDRNEGGKFVIFGSPDFNNTDKPVMVANAITDSVFRGVDLFRGGVFQPLPGTLKEINEITSLLQKKGDVITFLDKEATEDHLKIIDSPRILHLATHGFFLPETGWRYIYDHEENMKMSSFERGFDVVEMGGPKLENPMHRSGIALAGANRLLRKERIPIGTDDGIVTAEEVAGLKLRDTDLVVLSACSTGRGEVKRGEGVLGLRRAFVSSGARTLIISLWEVPDKETQELMTKFYEQLLAGGSGKQEALHKAKISMIEKLRREKGSAHPRYWAAFILSGERD